MEREQDANPIGWALQKAALSRILSAPEADQPALLDALSQQDPQLGSLVRGLWQADRDGPWTAPTLGPLAADLVGTPPLQPGDTLGPFEILREIGRGGMGHVYLARRAHPFTQNAAIKVMRGLGASPAMRLMFERERQILASLEHPSIARVLDGGETPDHLPYLVMEFVEGLPLDPARLGERTPFDIAMEICEAVEYAHQRFVVHGDLKPANLLLTTDGHLKLLDFGLAGWSEPSLFLTPGYASPEQQRGEPLTIAADVYSLGALLRALFRQADSELASILDRAQAALPSDRYQSVTELRLDLIRWKEDRPLAAKRSDRLYVLRKFISRNRLAAAFAALTFLTLTGATAYSFRQANLARAAQAVAESQRLEALAQRSRATAALRAAEDERARADSQRKLAESRAAGLYDLSTASLRDFYDPARAPEFPASARRFMVEKSLQHLAALSREAPSDPHLLEGLAEAYIRAGDLQGNPANGNLGDRPAALQSYAQAERIVTPSSSPNAQLIRLQARMRQADLLLLDGQPARAAGLYAAAVTAWRKSPPVSADGSVETGRLLAIAIMKQAQGLILQGKTAGARPLLEDSVGILQPLAQLHPANSVLQRSLISAYSRLGFLHRMRGETAIAAAALDRAASIGAKASKLLPDDTNLRQNAATIAFQQGQVEVDRGNVEAALAFFQTAMRQMENEMRRDPADRQAARAWSLAAASVVSIRLDQNRVADAMPLIDDLESRRRALISAPKPSLQDHLDLALTVRDRARALRQIERFSEAQKVLRESLARLSALDSASDFRLDRERGETLYALAQMQKQMADPLAARATLLESRAVLQPHRDKEDWVRKLLVSIDSELLEKVQP